MNARQMPTSKITSLCLSSSSFNAKREMKQTSVGKILHHLGGKYFPPLSKDIFLSSTWIKFSPPPLFNSKNIFLRTWTSALFLLYFIRFYQRRIFESLWDFRYVACKVESPQSGSTVQFVYCTLCTQCTLYTKSQFADSGQLADSVRRTSAIREEHFYFQSNVNFSSRLNI